MPAHIQTHRLPEAWMDECEAVNEVTRHELLQEEPEIDCPLSRIHFYQKCHLALHCIWSRSASAPIHLHTGSILQSHWGDWKTLLLEAADSWRRQKLWVSTRGGIADCTQLSLPVKKTEHNLIRPQFFWVACWLREIAKKRMSRVTLRGFFFSIYSFLFLYFYGLLWFLSRSTDFPVGQSTFTGLLQLDRCVTSRRPATTKAERLNEWSMDGWRADDNEEERVKK